MSDQSHETDLDEKIHSSVADKVMSFVEEGDDQEIRATRNKIEAFDEQINDLDGSIEHMRHTIEGALETLQDKERRRTLLNARREIEHDKLHQLEKLARSNADQ